MVQSDLIRIHSTACNTIHYISLSIYTRLYANYSLVTCCLSLTFSTPVIEVHEARLGLPTDVLGTCRRLRHVRLLLLSMVITTLDK